MPKPADYALIWAEDQNNYTFLDSSSPDVVPWVDDEKIWQEWLNRVKSFSFQGKGGQLNLVKESRPNGGAGYWYAYRRAGSRTLKKYAGRSATLNLERLETIAYELNQSAPSLTLSPNSAPDSNEFVTQHSRLSKLSSKDRETGVSSSDLAGNNLPETAPSPALLLEPKLQIPRLHPSLVRRERLLNLLDRVRVLKLGLLSAPAGFGKTTLVRQWLALPDPPLAVGWLALDQGDNDPLRFWRYVIRACRSFLVDEGRSVMSLLPEMPQLLFEPISLQKMLTTFLNSLTQTNQEGLLVLEDYHVIETPLIHETLAFFIEHLPPSLHLVIITRYDPPLPLARLRASGDVLELHAAELRFSREEAQTFIEQLAGRSVAADIVARLDEQVEGWAAGLRLLALALQGQSQIEKIVRGFTGSHRYIQDYFVSEVLKTQPEPLQTFMLQTSLLSRLTASLCETVTGREDAGQLLEKLAQSNLFLEPLDEAGEWYRYHALFAEAVQQEARHRLSEEAYQHLLLKASRWYEARGFTAEAVEMALQANDLKRAAKLIEWLIGNQHFLIGALSIGNLVEFPTLRRWLQQFPPELLGQYPLLCLSYASNLFMVTTQEPLSDIATLRQQIKENLQMAETSWRQEGNTAMLGQVFAFRSLLARQQDQSKVALTWAKQALDWLPEDQAAWRGLSFSVLGFHEMSEGSLNKAAEYLNEARILTASTGNPSFVRANTGMLGWAYLERGELHRAATTFRQMLAEARQQGDLDDIRRSTSALAQINYEWNDLDTVVKQAQELFELAQALIDDQLKLESTLLLARAKHYQGQQAYAQELLQDHLAQINPELTVQHSHSYRLLEINRVQLQLAAGDILATQRWWHSRRQTDDSATESNLPFSLQLREDLLGIRLLLAQGESEKALLGLEKILDPTIRLERFRAALEIRVVMALAYAANRQMAQARQLLQTILSEAHSEGYIRLFVDEGQSMQLLLQSLKPQLRPKHLAAYLQTILEAFAPPTEKLLVAPAANPSGLFEPLSGQEQRVLQLLVAGLSNPEIARELVVSVNTIRSQVQSIYRKLGVNNRVAAGEVVRRFRLL